MRIQGLISGTTLGGLFAWNSNLACFDTQCCAQRCWREMASWYDTADKTEAFPSMISPTTEVVKPPMHKRKIQGFRQFDAFSLLLGETNLCVRTIFLGAACPGITRAVAFVMLVVAALTKRRMGTALSGPIISGPLDDSFTVRVRAAWHVNKFYRSATLVVPMFVRGITIHQKDIDISLRRIRSRIAGSGISEESLRSQRGHAVENIVSSHDGGPPFGMELALLERFVEHGSHGPVFAPKRGGERNSAAREPWFFPVGFRLLNSNRERPCLPTFAQDTSSLSIDPGNLGVDVELI